VVALTQYEKPANQSEAVRLKRAEYGEEYFRKYAQGTEVYPPCPYVARITATELNVRSGPGPNYPVVRTVVQREAFTIVDRVGDWGKLKSGVGYINLQYTEPV
jgi:uncharacterized protein YgiM (DUF1202 family)